LVSYSEVLVLMMEEILQNNPSQLKSFNFMVVPINPQIRANVARKSISSVSFALGWYGFSRDEFFGSDKTVNVFVCLTILLSNENGVIFVSILRIKIKKII
jgi:hypothetical protein